MSFFTKLFRSRDKPRNSYHFGGWPFVFGKSAAGAKVNVFTAMQTTTIYACARILVEFIAGGLLECPRHIDNKKTLQK